MDGRGRAFDNIIVERLWRSVKYEEVYLKDYCTPAEAFESLGGYFDFYNNEMLHQSFTLQLKVKNPGPKDPALNKSPIGGQVPAP